MVADRREAWDMRKQVLLFSLLLVLVCGLIVFPPSKIQFLVLEKLAATNEPPFLCSLAKCYYRGTGVKQDFNKALFWYQKAADLGSLKALCKIGHIFSHYAGKKDHFSRKIPGFWDGIQVDYQKAIEWYTKAAQQGSKCAQWRLGFLSVKGYGAPRDYKKSLTWFTKAALQGHAQAECWLGHLYSHAVGIEYGYEKAPGFWDDIPLDYARAVEWYTKSAHQGYGNAQTRLGFLYSHGEGTRSRDAVALSSIEVDYERAAEWYQQAADQGKVEALRTLGYLYFMGKGVARNEHNAFRLCLQAAECGDSVAQTLVAYMYECGLGVTQSYEQALAWYTKAAESGDDQAIGHAHRLRLLKPQSL